jgi:prophage regulatory protein
MNLDQPVQQRALRGRARRERQQPVWLTLSEVEERLGLTKATIYRLIRCGQFPRQVKIGAQAVRWHRSAIEAWEASKLAEAVND